MPPGPPLAAPPDAQVQAGLEHRGLPAGESPAAAPSPATGLDPVRLATPDLRVSQVPVCSGGSEVPPRASPALS